MAPSVRGSNVRIGKSQSTLHSFGRVSKVASSSFSRCVSAKQAVASAESATKAQPCVDKPAKRRRDDDNDEEDHFDFRTQIPETSRAKKVR